MSCLLAKFATYFNFGESKLKDLSREIASRSTAWDYSGLLGLLPDPDPVLRRRGGGAEILEELTGDGHLLSVMQTRKLGTLKREYKWEPGTDGESEAAPAAKRLCNDFLSDLEEVDLYNVLSAVLDAPYYGMIPIELMWKPGKGEMRLIDLRALPSRWFGFDEDNNPRFRSMANPWGGETLPWGKFVFARHFPTYDNPYGLRLLSRCFWPVTFKKGGIKFWVTFMEKYGMPFLLGKYRPGATTDEQQLMLSRLVQMVQDAVAVVPEGNTVEMVGGASKTGGSDEAYSRLIETMNAEISKVIMGQTLTAEVGDTGSYAAGKVHEGVLDDYRQADQTLVKSVMTQLGKIYRDLNAPGVPAPVFSWFETEDPQQDFADRDKVLTEGGQLRLTKAYYMRRYNFREDDIEMAEAAQSAGDPKAATKTPGSTPDQSFAEPPAYTPEQQALEDLADQALAGVDLGNNEAMILQAVLDADSYEQAIENLLAMYPDLDMSGLQAMSERAMMAAEMFGRMTGGSNADQA